MAKKKTEEIATEEIVPIETESVLVEETPVVEEISEEPKKDYVEAFIENKLRVLNQMNNPAKVERLARRILANRKGN